MIPEPFQSLLQMLDFLRSHQWVFWILVNLSAYLTYWMARYGRIGVLGIVFPLASGACTVMFAPEWWMGSIGIATILATATPFFVIAWKGRKQVVR